MRSTMAIRIRAVSEPFESADPDAAREAVEALVLAEAMGLLGDEAVERLDLAAVRRVARAASEAGIGTGPTAALAARRVAPRQLRAALQTLREALEDSPASLRRYASRSRPTPDAVAARLHFLARVVAELKGAYNDIGVRRWFQRKRTLLRGKAPSQILKGDWSPEDRSARKVLDLARSLAFSPVT